MSVQVENNLAKSGNKEIFDQKAHYIPCRIDENGPANVEQYFEKFVQKINENEYTGTFRGRPLDGVKMKLPKGYQAVLVTEAKRPLAENADRRFQVTGGFKLFNYWNWDKKPSRNDNFVKAMDWIDIANAIS